jgi:hypothetical protein
MQNGWFIGDLHSVRPSIVSLVIFVLVLRVTAESGQTDILDRAQDEFFQKIPRKKVKQFKRGPS